MYIHDPMKGSREDHSMVIVYEINLEIEATKNVKMVT